MINRLIDTYNYLVGIGLNQDKALRLVTKGFPEYKSKLREVLKDVN